MADLPEPAPEIGSYASVPPVARPVGLWAAPSSLSRRDALFDILLVACVLIFFSVLSVETGFLHSLEDRLPLAGKYIWVIGNGLVAMAGVALVLRLRHQGIASIGLGRAAIGRVLTWAAIAIPVCYAAGAICNVLVTIVRGSNFIAFAQERTDFFDTISDISIRQILPVTVFIGLYEEILFRGFLLSRMSVLCRDIRVAIILTSVIFGSLHYTQGVTGMFQTGVIGLVLAIVVTRARSLWPSILAHACIDALSLIVMVLFLPELRKFMEQVTTSSVSG